MYKIKKATEELPSNLSDESVINFMNIVKKMAIPNEDDIWNTLRAAGSIVQESSIVSTDVKERFILTLQSKGVYGVHNKRR